MEILYDGVGGREEEAWSGEQGGGYSNRNGPDRRGRSWPGACHVPQRLYSMSTAAYCTYTYHSESNAPSPAS